MRGNGTIAVTATGINTEIGKIWESLKNEEETRTPLEKSLTKVARLLIFIAY